MKKIFFALAFAAVLLVGCQPKKVLVSKITLSQTAGSVVEGETLKLNAIVTPKEATNPELTWSSNSTAVATVSGDGVVTGVKEGSAKITAAAVDGSGVTAVCEITVTKKVIPVTAIQLNETSKTLKKDETLQLTAVYTPSDATYQTANWTSSKTDVATVDATGKVTAKAAGTATITAEASNDPGVKATCEITVVEPKPMFVQYPSALLRTGGTLTQTVWYGTVDNYAARQTTTGLTWSSDNTGVATVEASKVTAVAPGKATISATDGLTTVSFVVTVEDKPARTYDEYLPGVSLYNCHDGTLAWNKKTNVYALTDGYVEGTQCMGAKINGYKIAETYFAPVDASSVPNPALFIRMYISDPSKLTTAVAGGEPLVEIRSTGPDGTPTAEKPYPYVETDIRAYWSLNEIFTNFNDPKPTAKQTLVAGWNNIVLPLSKATHNQLKLNAINYFRIYQLPNQTYQEVEFRFDQIRIVDWTEFERCDNFAMWRDRPAQQNKDQYVNDTEGKAEGTSCVACKDVLFTAVNSYRLEMWPGLEYAMPAMYDYKDLALKLQFFVAENNVAWFNKYINFNVEVSSQFTPDNNGIDFSVGIGGDKPYTFKAGWNEMVFNFADFEKSPSGEAHIKGDWNLRKMNYFRIVLTPMGFDPNKDTNPDPVQYVTYKLDDIRIIENAAR